VAADKVAFQSDAKSVTHAQASHTFKNEAKLTGAYIRKDIFTMYARSEARSVEKNNEISVANLLSVHNSLV
jgi:hypothetical protein